ncbi:MAG: HAD family phosphatase [Phycisphaeraceae bacterium]|nr:HAD family phosphatase [Phycisphaeraceae bacterium]
MLQALVFDFDGVIVDSEPLHFRAFVETARPLGVSMTWEQYLKTFVGYDDRDAFRVMLGMKPGIPGNGEQERRIAELAKEKGRAFERQVRSGAHAIPGVLDLIRDARKHVPLAISSGATRADIDLVLGPLGLDDTFNPIVTADDVERSKPDPQCYALAVRKLAAMHPKLKLRPQDCLAIEDTAAGIAAARAAGLMTLGIGTTGALEALHEAHRAIPNLQGVTFDLLQQWFND